MNTKTSFICINARVHRIFLQYNNMQLVIRLLQKIKSKLYIKILTVINKIN